MVLESKNIYKFCVTQPQNKYKNVWKPYPRNMQWNRVVLYYVYESGKLSISRWAIRDGVNIALKTNDLSVKINWIYLNTLISYLF